MGRFRGRSAPISLKVYGIRANGVSGGQNKCGISLFVESGIG